MTWADASSPLSGRTVFASIQLNVIDLAEVAEAVGTLRKREVQRLVAIDDEMLCLRVVAAPCCGLDVVFARWHAREAVGPACVRRRRRNRRAEDGHRRVRQADFRHRRERGRRPNATSAGSSAKFSVVVAPSVTVADADLGREPEGTRSDVVRADRRREAVHAGSVRRRRPLGGTGRMHGCPGDRVAVACVRNRPGQRPGRSPWRVVDCCEGVELALAPDVVVGGRAAAGAGPRCRSAVLSSNALVAVDVTVRSPVRPTTSARRCLPRAARPSTCR